MGSTESDGPFKSYRNIRKVHTIMVDYWLFRKYVDNSRIIWWPSEYLNFWQGFLDRHYVGRSHDPCPGLMPIFVKKSKSPFFSLRLFSFASFFLHLFSDYLTSACVSSRQIIVESCDSPSNNPISLSYSMSVFSANLFGLF